MNERMTICVCMCVYICISVPDAHRGDEVMSTEVEKRRLVETLMRTIRYRGAANDTVRLLLTKTTSHPMKTTMDPDPTEQRDTRNSTTHIEANKHHR